MAATLILASLITVVFSTFFYNLQKKELIKGIDNKLYSAAFMARGLLPADYHDKIINKDSVSVEEFESTVTRYNQICKSLDLEYLWSLMQIDGKIVFTTATSPDKITENKKHAKFFEIHSNPELYVPTFLKMTPTYQTSSDKWGDIRVVIIPFKDASGRPYLFGASMSLAKVNLLLKEILLYCILIGISVFLANVALSHLFALLITRPIKNLVDTIKNNVDTKMMILAKEEGSQEQVMLTKNFNILIRELDAKITEAAENEENLRVTLHSIGDGVISTDREGKVIHINSVAEQLTGWKSEEVFGKPFAEVFNLISETNGKKLKDIATEVLATGKICELEKDPVLISRDGTRRNITESSAPINSKDGSVNGAVIIFRDITEKKKHEEKLKHLSFHDKLTGLYNRAYFEEELLRLDTKRQLPLGFIMGDLNGLKIINDTFGHTEGDSIIKKAAELLKKVCRKDDIIARWGGDEFVVLLPRTKASDTEEIIKRIKAESKKTAGLKAILSISIGTATKSEEGQDIQAVINDAESNMYKNKLIEKNSLASSIMFALEQTLYEKSNETKEHTDRVRELAVKLGKAARLQTNQLDEISLLASLHDIGKVAIPEETLMKVGKLTEKEWENIKRHPEIGYNIAQSSPQISHVAKYILACHENWDGSGYPQGLKEESIPLISRIIFIADSYDVMTTGRKYKKPMAKEEAIKELERCAGTQFDPVLVDKFIQIVSDPKFIKDMDLLK